MPQTRTFSESENQTIRALRADQTPWTKIATGLGCGKLTILTHASRVLLMNTGNAPPATVRENPLHRHRSRIACRVKQGASPGDIADELNDRDNQADFTDALVLAFIDSLKLDRAALPAGHAVTWGAIAGHTPTTGSAYKH